VISFVPGDHSAFKTVGFLTIKKGLGKTTGGLRAALVARFWYGTFTNPADPSDGLDANKKCAVADRCAVIDTSNSNIPADRLYLIPVEGAVSVELVEFGLRDGAWPKDAGGQLLPMPSLSQFEEDPRFPRIGLEKTTTSADGRAEFSVKDSLYSIRAPALLTGKKKGPGDAEVDTAMIVVTFEVKDTSSGSLEVVTEWRGPDPPEGPHWARPQANVPESTDTEATTTVEPQGRQ